MSGDGEHARRPTALMRVRLLIRAKSEPGARRVVAKLAKHIGYELEIESCERYRKDVALFDIGASAPLWGASREEIVYAVLHATASFHSDRFVGGPSEYEGGKWEIRIDATARKDGSLSGLPGLVWFEGSAGNVGMDE